MIFFLSLIVGVQFTLIMFLVVHALDKRSELKARNKKLGEVENSLTSKIKEAACLRENVDELTEDLKRVDRQRWNEGRVSQAMLELIGEVDKGQFPPELCHAFCEEIRPQIMWIGMNFFRQVYSLRIQARIAEIRQLEQVTKGGNS